MLKYLFSLLLSIFFVSTAIGQSSTDTLVYFLKNDGEMAQTKAEADYTLVILPDDQGDKQKLYPVLAFYPDGKRKMIATSSSRSNNLSYEGAQVMFFPNGKRAAVTMYSKGVPKGEEVTYYPNGGIYTRKNFDKNKKLLLECRDSTGLILTQDGSGKWLMFDQSFTNLIDQGLVENGIMTGTWSNLLYATRYLGGPYVELPYLFQPKIKPPSSEISDKFSLPDYKNLGDTLNRFITNNLDENTKKAIVGRQMYLQFSMTPDGVLNSFKVFNSPSQIFSEELIRVVKLSSPWPPYYSSTQPVYKPLILPVYFSKEDTAPSITKDSTTATLSLEKDKVFVPVERSPEFPGGAPDFTRFLEKTLKYPEFERNTNIQGKVFISFVVEKDGSISEVHTVRTSSIGLAEEALRVIRLSPKWIPAIANGQPVRVNYTIPLNFTLGENVNVINSDLSQEVQVGKATYINTPSGAVYLKVEEMPKFPGGINEFKKFISSIIQYPATARENNIKGKVKIAFIVENDGSISNVETVDSKSQFLSNECMRVIKLSPLWIPGSEKTRKVRVRLTVPFDFKLNNNSSEIIVNNPY